MTQITASVYRTNGTIETIVSHNNYFTLEQLQKAVDGRIQAKVMNKTQHIICNEEGRLLGLQLNPHFPQFVGDVILINEQYY